MTFAQHQHLFEHVAAFSTVAGKLTGSGDSAVIAVAGVTAEFFEALGVAPETGRAFTVGDDETGADRIIVLSDSLWSGRFAADPAIAGKGVTIDGVRRVVVGVMPAGFTFPDRTDAWIPQRIQVAPHLSLLFPVLGRLRPDVNIAQARAEFYTLSQQLFDNPQGETANLISGLVPLKEFVVSDVRRPLEVFAGAVSFLLLIACANLANLLLARASGRRREIAVRAALGASRSRLIRQLLAESLLLAAAGAACSVLVAQWAVPALLALAPDGVIPRAEMIGVDARVLGFAVGISMVAGVVFGLAPALRLTRARLRDSLLPGGRWSSNGNERLGAALVVCEIALALVLLAGAGVMLRSFLRLSAVDPGFRPDNVITMTLDLQGASYSTLEQRQAFHAQVLARLSAIPGAAAVGAVNWCPLGRALMRGDFHFDGGPIVPDDYLVDKPAVSPGYFSAMGIRLVRGRDFTDTDDSRSVGVAIVSRSIARMFGSQEAVGRRVTLETTPKPEDWLTIVGVVDDVKQTGLSEPLHAAIYRPYKQITHAFFLGQMTFAVRAASSPIQLAPAMRTMLREVDPNQPPQSITPMSDTIAAATANPRFQARLLGAFALLALVLAAVGTYGVLAYSVAQRTHEIGVRIALGARGASVLWMVLQRTLLLTAIGVGIGIAGALAATRVLETFLFEIRPDDPRTLAGAVIVIIVTALLASLVPARRATRVDPLLALKHE